MHSVTHSVSSNVFVRRKITEQAPVRTDVVVADETDNLSVQRLSRLENTILTHSALNVKLYNSKCDTDVVVLNS